MQVSVRSTRNFEEGNYTVYEALPTAVPITTPLLSPHSSEKSLIRSRIPWFALALMCTSIVSRTRTETVCFHPRVSLRFTALLRTFQGQ